MFRALPVMDELVDYVNKDPLTGKHLYEMTDEERKALSYDLIDIPEWLVKEFKRLYHGNYQEAAEDRAAELFDPYDEIIGLKHLAPGTTIDVHKMQTVKIRKPIRFRLAYDDFPAAWTAFVAGFCYQVQEVNAAGFPVTKLIPMVDWTSDEVNDTWTYEIPYIVWVALLENAWQVIAPVCTMIERIIARTLTDKGFNEAQVNSSHPDLSDSGIAGEAEESLDLS